MRKPRPRGAWIIHWVSLPSHRPIPQQILHVLNPRVNYLEVIRYMKCLYLNSDMQGGYGRLRYLSNKFWKHEPVRIDGRMLTVGDDPCLMAWRVDDLTIEIDYKNSREVFRWTQPPGSRYDAKTQQVVPFGKAIPREESLPYPCP